MVETLLQQFADGRRPPASRDQLDAAQEQLGLSFPPGLVAFYLQSNGLVVHERHLILNDLATATDYAAVMSDIDLVEYLGLLPLSESNDSNPYCVSCKPPLSGRIIHLQHDDAPRLAFPDLDSFALAIVSLASSPDWTIDDIDLGYAADHSDRTPADDLAADELLAGDCPDVENLLSIAMSLFSRDRLDSIIGLLEHESMWVREDAARHLGEMGDSAAIESLQLLAGNGDQQDNRAAQHALNVLNRLKRGQ